MGGTGLANLGKRVKDDGWGSVVHIKKACRSKHHPCKMEIIWFNVCNIYIKWHNMIFCFNSDIRIV